MAPRELLKRAGSQDKLVTPQWLKLQKVKVSDASGDAEVVGATLRLCPAPASTALSCGKRGLEHVLATQEPSEAPQDP